MRGLFRRTVPRHFHGGLTSAASVHPDELLAVHLQERSFGAAQREFSCFDSSWHCMIVCEGSAINSFDSDQLWYVLEVTPHGIVALGGTVRECDLLRNFETDGAERT